MRTDGCDSDGSGRCSGRGRRCMRRTCDAAPYADLRIARCGSCSARKCDLRFLGTSDAGIQPRMFLWDAQTREGGLAATRPLADWEVGGGYASRMHPAPGGGKERAPHVVFCVLRGAMHRRLRAADLHSVRQVYISLIISPSIILARYAHTRFVIGCARQAASCRPASSASRHRAYRVAYPRRYPQVAASVLTHPCCTSSHPCRALAYPLAQHAASRVVFSSMR